MSASISVEDDFPLTERGEIYLATNSVTNKSYVGQAVSCLSSGTLWGTHKRWIKHISNATTGKFECNYLESSIAKHGPDVWTVVILEYCSIDQMNTLEDKYIQLHGTLVPSGYNLMTGGGNGRKHHDETRKKMRATRTGMIHSEESKEKRSIALTGRVTSEETRRKQRESWTKRGSVTFTARLNRCLTNRDRIMQVLKELNIEQFAQHVTYNTTASSEGFCVKRRGLKRFSTTSQKKTMIEKYKECLDYLSKMS